MNQPAKVFLSPDNAQTGYLPAINQAMSRENQSRVTGQSKLYSLMGNTGLMNEHGLSESNERR
jgi:hypothetical protein